MNIVWVFYLKFFRPLNIYGWVFWYFYAVINRVQFVSSRRKKAGGIVLEFPLNNVICEYEHGSDMLMAAGGDGRNADSNHGRRVRRSEAQLRQAAECVSRGQTFQTVSHMFKIPISTIRFYMARRGILPRRKRGRTAQYRRNSTNTSTDTDDHLNQSDKLAATNPTYTRSMDNSINAIEQYRTANTTVAGTTSISAIDQPHATTTDTNSARFDKHRDGTTLHRGSAATLETRRTTSPKTHSGFVTTASSSSSDLVSKNYGTTVHISGVGAASSSSSNRDEHRSRLDGNKIGSGGGELLSKLALESQK